MTSVIISMVSNIRTITMVKGSTLGGNCFAFELKINRVRMLLGFGVGKCVRFYYGADSS